MKTEFISYKDKEDESLDVLPIRKGRMYDDETLESSIEIVGYIERSEYEQFLVNYESEFLHTKIKKDDDAII